MCMGIVPAWMSVYFIEIRRGYLITWNRSYIGGYDSTTWRSARNKAKRKFPHPTKNAG